MWQVLVAARTMPTRTLVILCDSLGLLQLLKGYRRKDYQYHPDVQAHFDVIRLILEELNLRKKGVHLVKVKSHVGIELNERADKLANAGLESEEVVCEGVPHTFPLWVTREGSREPLGKLALFKAVRQRYHDQQRRVLRKTAGISTQNFLADGLGQRFMAKAGRMLKMGNFRLWILSKGDGYPTQYHRYRTGQAEDDRCTVPGCDKRETYDHCVCSCKVVSAMARAVHDRVWRGVFDVIKASAPKGTLVVYHTAIKSIPCLKSSI